MKSVEAKPTAWVSPMEPVKERGLARTDWIKLNSFTRLIPIKFNILSSKSNLKKHMHPSPPV